MGNIVAWQARPPFTLLTRNGRRMPHAGTCDSCRTRCSQASSPLTMNVAMTQIDTAAEFTRRISNEFLSAYCTARGYAMSGFRPASISVAWEDARDFLRAFECGLMVEAGKSGYRLPRSTATEVLFWEGLRAVSPRPIYLWREPVITIAAVARLHLDYGWPRDCLGMQPPKWAFDFSASLQVPAGAGYTEYVLGEVKKSAREVDALIRDMHSLCESEPIAEPPRDDRRRNAYRKWRYLRNSDAVLFWAVGPAKTGQLFEVQRSASGKMSLGPTHLSRLSYPACM